MDLSNYLLMKQEMSLMVVFLILIVYDLFASENLKKYFQPVACLLFLAHTIYGFFPQAVGTSFAGMYVCYGAEISMKNILNIGVLLVLLQSNGWLSKEDTSFKRGEFFMLTLLTLFGMYLMISSGNFILFYIGLETASLPMAALAAFDKYKNNSAEAGAKYIFNAVFSSACLLFGLSFLYGACGTFYFEDLAICVYSTPLLVMSLVFISVGLFFKISLVPFHFWTADVYQGAPTNVTAYLSTISKGAAVFALMAILYKVFGNMYDEWQNMLWWIVLITITVGNLFAMRQTNLKRFLAFSSVSQAGYIALAILAGSIQGMASAMYYILVYIFSNMAAFGVINAIETKTGKVDITDYNGLYKTNPNLALAMMIAVFSLGGIPPLAGFFSKFFVFTAAAAQGQYLLVLFALLNTIISLYYYLLVVKAMFINPNETPIEKFKSDGYMKISLVFCMIGLIVVGFARGIYEYLGLVGFGA
ncbi:MAG: NADH-quinone oxidoreductase subunit N [Bacteroidales bacterium]|nr:NADH-quinone oxidoreductase subunit N [Bacteroidales bacterium]MDD4711881.1 NADH-quinone oxidoreductase subunit N [Bacteroidales bacterium]